MKTLFISDLHIRGLKDPTMKIFLSFLDQEKENLSRLIIVGDLFDFWVGIKNVVFDQYLPILNKLLELKQKGIQIDYIEGNHDFALGTFFRDILNAHVIRDEAILKVGNYSVYASHGDQVNSKDYGYLFLRWFLRTPLVKLLVEILPPSWIWKLSQKSSHTSRIYRTPDLYTVEMFRRFAKQKLEENSIDVVVLGHTHYPDEQYFEIHGKKKIYFNTGDWIRHYTYLEFTEGHTLRLKKFSISKSV